MKRIVTIQDLSGVGKCSLGIALPVISAMGVESACLPTAVLSTHTAFPGFTFHDLTGEIKPISEHWKSQGITFDAVYTGYLGSFAQIELVSRFIRDFKRPENIVFIDPAMGDAGRLYPGFSPAFAREMGRLCAQADITVPNLTEACFLLDLPYEEAPDQQTVREMLRRLCGMGAKRAAITGVGFASGNTGVMMYDASADTFFAYEHLRQPSHFHGTGDLFASACVGALMNGLGYEQSLVLAADYTAYTIEQTLLDPHRRTYGVQFEATIPALLTMLSQAKPPHQ
ncbi:MAG: pyridoxamine kinase [Eubacteriales bacterium]